MDILSETLRMIRLSGSLLARANLTAPWGLTLPETKAAYFHIAIQGNCGIWREPDDPVLWLKPGDIAVLPHGTNHQLKDDAGSTVDPCPQFEGIGTACPKLSLGGGGPKTDLVCGQFHLEGPEIQPLFAFLPPIIHLPRSTRPVDRWLDTTLQLIADETASPRLGHDVLLDRLLGVLYIQVIRAYSDHIPNEQKGWLAGTHDPMIAQALKLIHSNPEIHRSLTSLAADVGVSRSVLASRFKETVGESPIAYATRWRMQVAAKLLASERLTVSETASRLGFNVEATFSRSFKRIVGLSPSHYRKQVSQT